MGWVEPVSAISTAAAAIIALGFGGTAEYRNYKDRRARRLSNERAQAEQVAAWTDVEEMRLYFTVQNASDQPIWHVAVVVPTDISEWAVPDEHRIPSGFTSPVIPPGSVERYLFGTVRKDAAWSRRDGLEVSFVDNAERRWWRSSQGVLERLRES